MFSSLDPASTEIYTLSLHDALPISDDHALRRELADRSLLRGLGDSEVGHEHVAGTVEQRSEEHTSELQSRQYLVCRLLLEKKNLTYASNCFGTAIAISSPSITSRLY